MRVTATCCWKYAVLSLLLLGLAWVPAPALAGEEPGGGRCLAFQRDLTDPALREILSQRSVIPAGPAKTVYQSGGKKVSQQTFVVINGQKLAGTTTTTCSGTCTGGCGVSGCDVTSSLGCSSCTCTGGSCTCSCTKTSTHTSAPGPGSGSNN